VAHGAHFGQVFGFERPFYFGKTSEPVLTFGRPDWFDHVGAEVTAAHEVAGLTELSSFGKIDVTGPDALACLEAVCTNRIDRPVGSACYTLMLNHKGGIESDLTVFRLGTDHFRLMVGTNAVKRDLSWIRNNCPQGSDVTINDITTDFAVLGLSGPDSARIATAIGAGWMNDIGYFRHQEGWIGDVAVRAARLSYVGEAGWELTCAAGDARALFATLAAEGAVPVGAFAQTAMRIEKGFLAYGHDLDTDVTPQMAGLEFALAKNKDFIGKAALGDHSIPATRLMSLSFEDESAVPLGNEPVLAGGRIIGKTTSAAFGYRVGRSVAIALVESGAVIDGGAVEVNIGGDLVAARMSVAPLFDPSGARMRQPQVAMTKSKVM
jgi:glycine cleavage system aminomethyltransferase T